MDRALLRRILLTALTVLGISGIAVLGVHVYRSRVFIGFMFSEAWALSWQTRLLTISVVGIIAFLISLAIKARKGWAEMNAHLAKHLFESIVPAIGSVFLFFVYNLLVTVPHNIVQ